MEEFLEAMQPRTKTGPSWANEVKPEQPVPPPEEPDDDPPAALSDLEWMKQRMSQNVEKVDKVFEQSDDDDETPAKVSIDLLPLCELKAKATVGCRGSRAASRPH
jgi:multiple RNA-binding domain-containing protein 1